MRKKVLMTFTSTVLIIALGIGSESCLSGKTHQRDYVVELKVDMSDRVRIAIIRVGLNEVAVAVKPSIQFGRNRSKFAKYSIDFDQNDIDLLLSKLQASEGFVYEGVSTGEVSYYVSESATIEVSYRVANEDKTNIYVNCCPRYLVDLLKKVDDVSIVYDFSDWSRQVCRQK